MKIILTFLSLVLFNQSWAQPSQDDEVVFASAIDWLNAKLDYVYYDKNSQKWWTNTFYINESKEVTIKQISSHHRITANIKDKNYTIRNFRIQDINPYSIEIKKVHEGTGRFVEGELLELHTFDGSRKIHKSINNRKATSTSFLHLSFPKSLTDSLSNYPQQVRDKFYEAVVAATKIHPIDPDTNRKLIFETMQGSYKSEKGGLWNAELRFDQILKITSPETERYFGYDYNKKKYFLVRISADGITTRYYREANNVKLILENELDPQDQILFYTSNSFQIGDEWYYRS